MCLSIIPVICRIGYSGIVITMGGNIRETIRKTPEKRIARPR